MNQSGTSYSAIVKTGSCSVVYFLIKCRIGYINLSQGLPWLLSGKESACSVGNLGSIPGLGRSPGEGNGYSFQHSGPGNSMDCIVHGVAKCPTQLSDFTFTFHPQRADFLAGKIVNNKHHK